jgi:hypothetical protein
MVANSSSSSNIKLENEKLKAALAKSSIESKKLENEIEILKLSNNLLVKSLEKTDITKNHITNQRIQNCDEKLLNFEKHKSVNLILKEEQILSEMSSEKLKENHNLLSINLNNDDATYTNNNIRKELFDLSERLDRKCNELIEIKEEISKCINKLF